MLIEKFETIAASSVGEYKEKGSRFIAYAFPVQSEDEVRHYIELLKSEHFSARHHCWAYRLLPNASLYRANDDGEPTNSAGKPILGQLEAYNVTNVVVIVVRYFGGVLLGVGGLMHAYKQAAKEALEQSKIITVFVSIEKYITCEYANYNKVIDICKANDATITQEKFDETCSLVISISVANEAECKEQLKPYINSYE